MAVPALIAVFMANTYIKTVRVSTTLECHFSICDRIYGCAYGSPIIHTRVHFPITEYRMNTITVAGSDAESVEGGSQIIPFEFDSLLVIILSIE
jgi:hypothetical protein